MPWVQIPQDRTFRFPISKNMSSSVPGDYGVHASVLATPWLRQHWHRSWKVGETRAHLGSSSSSTGRDFFGSNIECVNLLNFCPQISCSSLCFCNSSLCCGTLQKSTPEVLDTLKRSGRGWLYNAEIVHTQWIWPVDWNVVHPSPVVLVICLFFHPCWSFLLRFCRYLALANRAIRSPRSTTSHKKSGFRREEWSESCKTSACKLHNLDGHDPKRLKFLGMVTFPGSE